jgi:hypothetical protein
LLSDDEWAQVACDVMHRTGLAPYGQEDDAVRWVAVRHGANHIHIVTMLARQDGGRPHLSNERYRLREGCRAAEERYGLRRTAPADQTAARRASRAENEKSARRAWQEPARVTLKRAVSTAAAGAASEQEFFALLADAGVLVRLRYSTRDPGQVTGYAVGLAQDSTAVGGPVWYGGGKLAPDLTLPKLRQRWHGGFATTGPQVTLSERDAIWEHVMRTAADAAEHIRCFARADPAAAADTAWAAADVLQVAAQLLGSRAIRQAADAFDRAARCPYGRIPRPTSAGSRLRRAARLLYAAGSITDDSTAAYLRLVIRLAALAEAVADLRARAAPRRTGRSRQTRRRAHVRPHARDAPAHGGQTRCQDQDRAAPGRPRLPPARQAPGHQPRRRQANRPPPLRAQRDRRAAPAVLISDAAEALSGTRRIVTAGICDPRRGTPDPHTASYDRHATAQGSKEIY